MRRVVLQGFEETEPIGIAAFQRAVGLLHDGVDRADHGGVVGQVVQQGDHRLLAGMGHVDAGKALAFRLAQDVGQGIRAHAHHLQIEAAIGEVEAEAPRLGLVHVGAAGLLNARADQTDQDAPSAHDRLQLSTRPDRKLVPLSAPGRRPWLRLPCHRFKLDEIVSYRNAGDFMR